MSSLWDRYQKYLVRHEALGCVLDVSRLRVRKQTGAAPGADTFLLT